MEPSPRRRSGARNLVTTTVKMGELGEMLQRRNATMSDQGDRLARREGTRLWYRVEPGSQHEDHLIWEGHQHEAQLADTDEAKPRARTGQLRSMQALQATLEQTESPLPVPQRTEEIQALTDWRDSPRHCPVLLLSATTLLDARQPGPLLGPGTTYRIVSVNDGVVCLQVRALDGQVGLGYCNAVDLMCYEPEIMYMRPEKRTRRQTARLGLSRLSQRITGGTGSLIG